MLKAAVIGVGSMGRNHARVYRELPGIELVGVCDADQPTAAQVGKTYAVPHYTDVTQLLDEQQPDLVSLAVPTALHYEVAVLLVERGIHALIEKPVTRTLAEGEKLIDLARSKKVTIAVGHIERFNPAIMELHRRLRAGMAGRVYEICTRRLSPYPRRIRDAGVVIDLASHDIDLMRYLVGEKVTRVFGETDRSINSEREDMFHGLIRFQNGVLGVVHTNWITPTKVRELTVTGARGWFTCNLLSQELFFYENETAPSQWDQLSILRGVSEGNILGIRIDRHEPLVAELSDFVTAVRDGRPPVVTAEEGFESLRLALACVQSANEVSIIKY